MDEIPYSGAMELLGCINRDGAASYLRDWNIALGSQFIIHAGEKQKAEKQKIMKTIQDISKQAEAKQSAPVIPIEDIKRIAHERYPHLGIYKKAQYKHG